MRLEDQPLADARGQPTTTDNLALLADKLFDDDPRIKHLLVEVLQQLQQQEDEIHRLQCISQQRQRDIQRQEDEIQRLREELAAFREEVALERAYDRQRLARLETPAPALREETAKDHLDRLFLEMHRLGHKQVRMKDAARILGLSVPQMKNIKPHIGDDARFVIVKDPSHKQRHLIRLV
jgi:hypothetical protein